MTETPLNSTKTILIVDDEEVNVDLISQIVERVSSDFHVITASDGKEALETLMDVEVHLVLLDIMMPGMDGFDVLAQIRQHMDLDELPVIMMSALDSSEDIVRGLELGANDYITKPFSLRLISTRLKTQLRLMQLAHQQREALRIAEHASQTQLRLMRIASHDLKNPINNLGMILDLVDANPPLAVEYMPLAIKSLNTMKAIITDFLDSDILRDGELSVNIEPVNAPDAIFDAMQTFQQTAAAKGVTMLHDIESATVAADPKRLAQVLSNLISNAIKYTYPSTTIYIQGYIDGTMYQVDVIDEGPGISEQEADKLFQPFSRLSNEPTAGEHSTGLGLWIVKQMVEAQGGEVNVNFQIQKGANFYVRLPLAR